MSTDTWGNPLSVVAKYGNDVTETTTSLYFNSGTDNLWMLSLPLSIEKKITRNNGNWTEKQVFEYNEKYSLQKLINYTSDGTKKVSEEVYGYDSSGNVITQSVKPYSSTDILTTSYEYSTDGVFLTKEIDPMLLSTTYGYNSSGLIVSKKDYLENTTTYEYDGMGRLIKTNYPDNTFSSASFTWESPVSNIIYCIVKSASNRPTTKVYYDALERELRNSLLRFDGTEMIVDTKYDASGRISQMSLPFKGNTASQWNTFTYDSYGRLSRLSYASGKSDIYAYTGTSITETKNGIAIERKLNSKEELVSVSDLAGKIIYNLRPDGQLSSIVAPGDVKTSFTYDEYGRQITIADPSAGIKTFFYDNAGNIKEEVDANNKKKTFLYDKLGRITTKTMSEFKTTYNYNSHGQLSSEVSDNGTSHTYEYDKYGLLCKERDNVPDGKWLEKVYTYSEGNISSVQFMSQAGAIATENYLYSNGYVSEIKLGVTSVWKLKEENAMGLSTSVITGLVTHSYTFDAFGIPTGKSASSASSGVFQNYIFGFDRSRGNLSIRKDNKRNIEEKFYYDNLNRLQTFAGSIAEYDIKGNVTRKSDIGKSFYYNTPNKPYAISGVDAESSTAIPLRDQLLSFTSFERPANISENGYEAIFSYDCSGSRKKMQVKKYGNNQLQRYYLGNCYEIDNGVSVNKQVLYIGGDAYTAPAVYVNLGSSWSLYYICRDYLGSVTHLVNSNGSVIEENSYDAWGRLRNPVTQEVYEPDSEPVLFLGRGYTGHEHLTQFGLINMNARLYDPATGRFLSPDPYVQMPDFSQSFNRYSYAMNNPLVYVDENGEFFFSALIPGVGVFLDAMCWSATLGAVTGGTRSMAQGQSFWSGAWKGAITGAAGGLMGPIGGAGMSLAANIGLGVLQGTLVGGLDAALWGTNVGKGFLWGGISGGAFATLTSDNMGNLLKGKGFKSNEGVFKDFAAGKYTPEGGTWQQDAIDYWGFEGKYVEQLKGPNYVESEGSALGSTNIKTGNIQYGNGAFNSFDDLNAMYIKELYHRQRYLSGNKPLEQDISGVSSAYKNRRYFPEEKMGFIHQYKNQGLYPRTVIKSFGQIDFYQMGTFDLDESLFFTKKWWHLIYRIPRRW